MSDRTGIATQFGLKLESAVGTVVTPDTFLPIISEDVKRAEAFTEQKAIRANRRVLTSNEWNSGNVTVAGPIQLELVTASLRPLLTLMFGAETGSGPYTYRPGDLFGKAATMQVGRPDVGGTVRPFTWGGVKINSWEIGCAAGEIATLGLDVQSCLVDEDTSVTALAATSYDSLLKPLKFSGASVTVASSAVSVTDMKIKGDLKLGYKWFVGSQFPKEPRQTDRALFTGELKAEFESLTAYNRYIAHTESALVMTFSGANSASLVITCRVRWDPMTPGVKGRDVVELAMPFTCVSNDANDYTAIQAVYTVPS